MTSVFFYIPNLIGYFRIVTLLAAFYYAFDWQIFCALYITSYTCDVFDGWAARVFNQASKLGAALDMTTDRCATAGLLMILGIMYREDFFFFVMCLVIDVGSHFIHMYSSALKGSSSHKSVDKERSVLLRIYYHNKPVLFTVCLLAEVYLSALYVAPSWTGPMIDVLGMEFIPAALMISRPVFFYKQFLSLLQAYYAAVDLVELERHSKSA